MKPSFDCITNINILQIDIELGDSNNNYDTFYTLWTMECNWCALVSNNFIISGYETNISLSFMECRTRKLLKIMTNLHHRIDGTDIWVRLHLHNSNICWANYRWICRKSEKDICILVSEWILFIVSYTTILTWSD